MDDRAGVATGYPRTNGGLQPLPQAVLCRQTGVTPLGKSA